MNSGYAIEGCQCVKWIEIHGNICSQRREDLKSEHLRVGIGGGVSKLDWMGLVKKEKNQTKWMFLFENPQKKSFPERSGVL